MDEQPTTPTTPMPMNISGADKPEPKLEPKSAPSPKSQKDLITQGIEKMLDNETLGGQGWWDGWELIKKGYYAGRK